MRTPRPRGVRPLHQGATRVGGACDPPWRRSCFGQVSARRFRCLLRQPHAGLRLPRKLTESGRPQLLDHLQRGSGELDQRRDINSLTCRCERLEMCRPAGQHVNDPMIIASLKMVEGHADLEKALVHQSYRATLGAPE